MRVAQRLILSVTILVAAFCGFASAASAAGLFDAATSTDMRAARSSRSTEGALRQRLVRLNASELARIVPAGADNAADRLQRAQDLDAPVTIDLFPGVSVTASRTDIDAREAGGYVWSGKSAGPADSFVTLVINNGEVLGHIQTAGKVFSIEPVSGALHRVIEIDQSKILDDLHPPPPPPGLLKNSETAAPAGTRAKTTINVIVAHTVNARKEVGTAAQMQARIDLAIALANTAFTNSGVLIKFTRVGGANEINYADATLYGGATSNNYTGVLCDVTGMANCFGIGNNKTATFNALRTKRNTVKADLVVLMRKQGTACGVAWVPNLNGSVNAGNENLGYSVVTSTMGGVYNCIEGNTLAHETGHNQGMNHDRVQYKLDYPAQPTPTKNQFNFGYVNKTAQFFTIMSYRSSCGNNCTRIPFFSTPLKKFNNKPVGIPQGTANAADGARLLNENRTTIGGYR